MSDAIISERVQTPTFSITHLLTLDGVKSRIAKKEIFTSNSFSCAKEKKQTKFTLILHFGKQKEKFLSVFLAPPEREVFVRKCKFTVLDVNFNEQRSQAFRDKLVPKTGWGYDDLFNLSDFSLPDDTICIRSEILFEAASTETEMSDFSSADPSLFHDLRKLFSDASNADVTIVVEGKTFMAHKALLQARSDYFRALFESRMEESRKNEVGFSDFTIILSAPKNMVWLALLE